MLWLGFRSFCGGKILEKNGFAARLGVLMMVGIGKLLTCAMICACGLCRG